MNAIPPQSSSTEIDHLAQAIFLAFIALGTLLVYLIYRFYQERENAVKRFALDLGLRPFTPGIPAGIPTPYPAASLASIQIPYAFTGLLRGIEAALYQTNQGFGMSGSGRVVLALRTDRQAAAPPPTSLKLKDAYSIQQGPWTLISVPFREATPTKLQALLDLYCIKVPESTIRALSS